MGKGISQIALTPKKLFHKVTRIHLFNEIIWLLPQTLLQYPHCNGPSTSHPTHTYTRIHCITPQLFVQLSLFCLSVKRLNGSMTGWRSGSMTVKLSSDCIRSCVYVRGLCLSYTRLLLLLLLCGASFGVNKESKRNRWHSLSFSLCSTKSFSPTQN